MNALTLTFESPELLAAITAGLRLSREEYRAFVRLNPELRLERTAEGVIVVSPPTFARTGDQNAEIITQLRNWARRDGTGVGFDSNTGFDLPDGSNRSPDAAWVTKERLRQLTEEERNDYLPLCPDFVVELRSSSDSLTVLQSKMGEWIANGARLAWLLDPRQRRVFVYRPGVAVEELVEPAAVSAAPELAGFTLDLAYIWNPEV